MKLEYGATYYQVGFADPNLTMPSLKPLVYIGENIFGNETESTYYFQDTVSVLIYGLVGEAEETSECKVSSFTQEDLGSDIVELEKAIGLLSKICEKGKSLGFPKLKKASGKWS